MSDTGEAPAGVTAGGAAGAPALPPELRYLKRLVTALAATMILGLLAIILVIVIRFAGEPGLPALPAAIALPAGETATAATFGPGWVAVVTTPDAAGEARILVYDAATGALRQSVALRR